MHFVQLFVARGQTGSRPKGYGLVLVTDAVIPAAQQYNAHIHGQWHDDDDEHGKDPTEPVCGRRDRLGRMEVVVAAVFVVRLVPFELDHYDQYPQYLYEFKSIMPKY